MDKNKEFDRKALFEKYKGLIYSIAKRFCGRGEDIFELFQIGCVGFLKAVNGFDESFNTQFSTYAVPYIAGEIKRHFRDGGQIKVSRNLKRIYIKSNEVKERYVKQYGCEPSVSYIAEKTGEKAEDVAQAFLALMPVSSIYDDDGKIRGEVMEKQTGFAESVCEKLSVEQAMKRLQTNLFEVIEKRYFQHMTQGEIAKQMNTSQAQVSRMEKKALSILRAELF